MSPLFEVRVPPVLIEALAPPVFLRPELPPLCVQGPRAFGFRGPHCLHLGFSYLQPKELVSSNSNILMYSYMLTPIRLKQWNTVTVTVIHYCIIYVIMTTTLHIVT